MKLQIKYMVSLRCKMMVEQELQKLGLHCTKVELGEVEILEEISIELRKKLKTALSNLGLELIEDDRNILIERIKKVVIEMIHYTDELLSYNELSLTEISFQLQYSSLAHLSNQFKKITGVHRLITSY